MHFVVADLSPYKDLYRIYIVFRAYLFVLSRMNPHKDLTWRVSLYISVCGQLCI